MISLTFTMISRLRSPRELVIIYPELGVSENSVSLNPMVLLIIIPIKWLFHWEYTQHFQTNPIMLTALFLLWFLIPGCRIGSPFFFRLLRRFHHVNGRCDHMRQAGAKPAGNKKSWARIGYTSWLMVFTFFLINWFQYVSILFEDMFQFTLRMLPSQFCSITGQGRVEAKKHETTNHSRRRKQTNGCWGRQFGWVRNNKKPDGFQEGKVIWETIVRQ